MTDMGKPLLFKKNEKTKHKEIEVGIYKHYPYLNDYIPI